MDPRTFTLCVVIIRCNFLESRFAVANVGSRGVFTRCGLFQAFVQVTLVVICEMKKLQFKTIPKWNMYRLFNIQKILKGKTSGLLPQHSRPLAHLFVSVTPSACQPGMQLQSYLSCRSTHTAFSWQSWNPNSHSFRSVCKAKKLMKKATTIGTTECSKNSSFFLDRC